MYGVVLWSDNVCNRAVIWCEDHHALAFFANETVDGGPHAEFKPGDLIKFDIREENDVRLAIDPYLVVPHGYPTLPGDLRSASAETGGEAAEPPGRADTVRHNEDRRVVVLRPNPRTGSPAAPIIPRVSARHC